MAHFTAGNANTLSKAGLPVNDASLYLAHFLGPSGATNLLKASASTPVDKVLDAKQITANPEALKGKTVGDVVQWATKKMTGTAVAAAPSAGLAMGQSQGGPVSYVGNSDVFMRSPQMTTQAMQQLQTEYGLAARRAEFYKRSGQIENYHTILGQMASMNQKALYVKGMQGLQEFALTGDTSLLSAVMSQNSRAPIGLRKRSDGLMDVFVNGELVQQGMKPDALLHTIRTGFDNDYAQSQAQLQAQMQGEQYKAMLDIQKEQAKAVTQGQVNMVLERFKGDIAQALAVFKNEGFKVSDAGDRIMMMRPGDPMVYQIDKASSQLMVDPKGQPVMGYRQTTMPVNTTGQAFGAQALAQTYTTPQQ